MKEARQSLHGTRTALFLAASLGFWACTKAPTHAPTAAPVFPSSFSGVWAGDAGPSGGALKFGAKVVLHDEAGAISGEFFNENPTKPGVYLPTGQIHGTREGGTLQLMSGVHTELPDGGTLEPQPLTLNYENGMLVGVRILLVPGKPSIEEALILRKQ
jgi:hypothetical protein